jgi:PiT family inorganic phosphate transporter
MSLSEFINALSGNWILVITTILVLLVVMINGWTDAPNAIATAVSTKAMTPKSAVLMAAIFNLFGVLFMTLVNSTVAQTLYKMVDFGGNSADALAALCAALVGILIWSTLAWYFGIPTSESHALIAGISGAAIALQGGMSGINGEQWMNVIYGLGLSTFLGFGSGYAVVKIIEWICKSMNRRKTSEFFRKAQVGGAASMAFMHGAQDGQKFMGVFLLGTALAQGEVGSSTFAVPIWLMILVSLVMGFGTSIGGYRIIKTVGMDMVKLKEYQGFASDLSATAGLLVCSLLGIPVSTTHMKTTAIMGVGAAKRLSAIRWKIVRDMVLTWVLTFPGCGLVGFLMAKLFLQIF